MSLSTLNPLQHLFQGIGAEGGLASHPIPGEGLVGALSLVGLDVGHLGGLMLALKTSRFLEALSGLSFVSATVGDHAVDSEDLDHLVVGWNKELRSPALTFDGSLVASGQVFSLYGTHWLSRSVGAVNGQALPQGLEMTSELNADLTRLRLRFLFEATERSPRIQVEGEVSVMPLLIHLHS